MIQDIPVLSLTQKRFYINVLQKRYEEVLKPVCQMLVEKELDYKAGIRGERRCR